MRIIHAQPTEEGTEYPTGVFVLTVDDQDPAADIIKEHVGPVEYWTIQSETLLVLADPEAQLPSDLPMNVPIVIDPTIVPEDFQSAMAAAATP